MQEPAAEKFVVEEQDAGQRVDRYLTVQLSGRSRSYVQKLIDEGHVLVNSMQVKSNKKLIEGEKVEVRFPALAHLELKPMDLPLNIIYENKDFLVLDKPAGMVVHPGTHGSHAEDSLVNALIHHCKGELSGINGVMRPGIIHRLDKDTSGLLVVAKNDKAHRWLSDEFKSRNVDKVYTALLYGKLHPLRGTIDAPLGRDTRDRKRMAVVGERLGKAAVTKYEVIHYYGEFTLVRVFLLTGRTHQIRVHFASIGYPIVGDDAYGKHDVNKKFDQDFGLKRQFLHATQLSFLSPTDTKKVEFESSLPFDLQSVLDSLSL